METCGFLLVKNLRYHQKVLPEKLFLGGSRSTPLCSQAAYNRSNPLLFPQMTFNPNIAKNCTIVELYDRASSKHLGNIF
jgi:hypothetical protein